MKKDLKFGTQEWADTTVNLISGCSHDCKYCYAKSMTIQYKRKTVPNWKEEVLNVKKVNKTFRKRDGWIMFPSSHDLTEYNLGNLDESAKYLKSILKPGNKVLVVTKPHFSVIERLCDELMEYKEHILFRMTIGSSDSNILKLWEPGAPSFEERKSSLIHAFEKGYQTSVSAEPMLDTDPIRLVDELSPWITETIWLGKPNQLIRRLKTNGCGDAVTIIRAEDLIKNQSDEWVMGLYECLKDNPKVQWKESIKKVLIKNL